MLYIALLYYTNASLLVQRTHRITTAALVRESTCNVQILKDISQHAHTLHSIVFKLVYFLPLQPLVSKVELERTKALAAEFGRPGGIGEKLQKLLEKRAEEKDNWVGLRTIRDTISIACKSLNP